MHLIKRRKGRQHCTDIQFITADRHTSRAPPTLQFVLVLDVQLLADQGVPQAQRAVEHLRSGGEDEGDGGHVGGLGGVQARDGAWFVALALASREVDRVLGDVEACHDSAGTRVHNQVDHVWLHLWVKNCTTVSQRVL